MKTKGRSLLTITLIYIIIPVVIFLIGWTKWYVWIPTVTALCLSAYRMLREFADEEQEFEDIKINILTLTVVISVLIIACILIGFGGIFPQSGDWYKHNAVIKDLVRFEWPVYYTIFDKSMLTYYLGQYMLPALIGKITFSYDVASAVMAVWGMLGVVLVYIHLVRICKANNLYKQLILVFIMLFFCGALNLCQNFLHVFYTERMNSLGSYHWVLVDGIMLQYRSNLIMLRWVYPQVLVPWIVTILFIEHNNNVRYYVPLILPTLLFGSFSFAAIAVMAIIVAAWHLLKRDITIKELFSLDNVINALLLGGVLFFYFLGNIQVDKPANSSFGFQLYAGDSIGVYIVFCLFMFGIYAMCTLPENKTNILWYINISILLILPWLKMGLCNDIVMSGSMPSLFVLMILVIKTLFDNKESQALGIRKGIIIATLVVGCLYPARELADNIITNGPGLDRGDGYATMKWFTDRESTEISEDLVFNYYTYDLDGKFFYEHIARKKL